MDRAFRAEPDLVRPGFKQGADTESLFGGVTRLDALPTGTAVADEKVAGVQI